MKRILTLAAALTLITTLTGCGSGAQSESALDTTSQTATEATQEETQTIDPFETFSINAKDSLANQYPSSVTMEVDYGEKDYTSDVFYDVTIVSADDTAIKLKADAKLKPNSESNYVLSSESKTFEINVREIPTHLLNEDMLTDESFKLLDQEFRNIIIKLENAAINNEALSTDDIELVSVYESLPIDKPSLNNYSIIKDNTETHTMDWIAGISFIEDENISNGFRVYCIYKIRENKYKVLTACPIILNDQILMDLSRSSIKNSFRDSDSKEAAIAAIEERASQYTGVELKEIKK